MRPLDAWVLARLMASVSVDGEVALMSEGMRPLGEALAGAKVEKRSPILQGFSMYPGAPAELARAIFDADPLKPAPLEEQQAWERAGAGPMLVARTIAASEVVPVEVEWLWRDRVPLGMLTLFSGDPKLGKSLATISMIARLTRGLGLPGDPADMAAGSALLLSAEDDRARTLTPRLTAAGADMTKVHFLSSIVSREDPVAAGLRGDSEGGTVEWTPTLVYHDLRAIEEWARERGDCRLIVIDPVTAYLGECDDHRNSDLRAVLTLLKEMAERLNVAIVLVTHHNKSVATGANGKYRVLGSIAYVGACRANFLFLKDPDDPEGRRVLVLDNGGNLAPKQPGLAYVIEDRGQGPFCDWQPGTVDLDADSALARAAKAAKAAESIRGSKRMASDEWLRQYLDGGSQRAADCLAEGQKQGFHPRAVQRARERIGARVTRIGFGDQGEFCWTLEKTDPEHGQSELAFGHR